MADTLVLEASAARREGSSPFGSTNCSCGGMADTLVSEARVRKDIEGSSPSRNTKISHRGGMVYTLG